MCMFFCVPSYLSQRCASLRAYSPSGKWNTLEYKVCQAVMGGVIFSVWVVFQQQVVCSVFVGMSDLAMTYFQWKTASISSAGSYVP